MRIDLGADGHFTAGMRTVVALLLLTVALPLSGCGHKKAQGPVPGTTGRRGAQSAQKLIVTPETGLAGRVVKVNMSGRFVVLNFPIGHLPVLDQRLNIYRLGLKVGEVRVTGPQLDDNVVADLVLGEAVPGDEVRDR